MMGYYFYYPRENKLCVARYAEFFKNSLISHEASGSIVGYDEIQRKDAQTSDNTIEHQPEVEHEDVEPQTDVNLVCIKAIRILTAISAFYDYKIWQMDVETAFLNGHLNEDVYMLGKCFARKDLGEAPYILGIKIYRDRSRRLIGLSQNAYIDKILKRFKMDASKRGSLPMQPNVDLSKTQGPSTPAENLTSRYQQNLGESQWTIVKNILKYLRNTKDMFLVYGGDSTTELSVTCYTNAEVECIAASEAAMEAIWIRKFIYGLGVVPSNDRPIDMYYDNTGAITIADEPGVQKGAKHFREKYHY
ncbi:retrotransposon protein, putative, ty1-copia subclass, partial [Tanacetum coccineum]